MQSQANILIVEDEPEILELLSTLFSLEGHAVVGVPTAEDGLRAFFARRPDLALIDIGLPGMDGIELCSRIREVSNVPVLFLTAMGEEADRVRGLRAGADDYIVKPFGSAELTARVDAALRRAAMPPDHALTAAYSDSEVAIDHDAHVVTVRGKLISLTPLEYRLLSALVQNRGRVLGQDRLLDLVWGADAVGVAPESVRLCVSHLRRKIEREPRRPVLVETVRGFGYRYTGGACAA